MEETNRDIWAALRRLMDLTHDLKWNGHPKYQQMYDDLGILVMGVLRPSQDTGKILAGIQQLKERLTTMSAASDQALADLTTQVAATNAGIQSAIVLLNGIPALLAASGVDPAAIATVTASLKAGSDALVAAVAADGPQPAPPGPVVTP